ncbi:MAG: OB-fold nucleic acid binding domain-containing protein, partial [Actinomycetota bacterium]|nr:OB-fold nucleic acid binding domain-containing protein [Actinomycetota bacterium]
MNISDIKEFKSNHELEDLRGWVDTIRHHGGLLFFELRDHDSKIQVVTDKPDEFENIKNEYYISISGKLVNREKTNINIDENFGAIEIELASLEVISESKTLPFQIEDGVEVDEQIRLKHRYLDIRRNEMKNNILARSKTFKSIRDVM